MMVYLWSPPVKIWWIKSNPGSNFDGSNILIHQISNLMIKFDQNWYQKLIFDDQIWWSKWWSSRKFDIKLDQNQILIQIWYIKHQIWYWSKFDPSTSNFDIKWGSNIKYQFAYNVNPLFRRPGAEISGNHLGILTN